MGKEPKHSTYKYIRIGREDDELVANYIHIERMDDDHIWLMIGPDGFDLMSDSPIRWIPQSGKWPTE